MKLFFKPHEHEQETPGTALPDEAFWEEIRYPGLNPEAAEIEALVSELPKKLAAAKYKRAKDFLFVLLVGGTGTGKSTVFNALCGKSLSETGVERPKTAGAVAFAHRGTAIEDGFPVPGMEVRRVLLDLAPAFGYCGAPGELVVVEHAREEISHLVLVDTPDIDSVETRNRGLVEDLYHLADAVVFVTSQEKYADEVPFRFLRKVREEGKPLFVLLNKSSDSEVLGEVIQALKGPKHPSDSDGFRALPFLSPDPAAQLADTSAFKDFSRFIFERFSKKSAPDFLRATRARNAGEIAGRLRRLSSLLSREAEAAQSWTEHLDIFFKAACDELYEQQKEHFTGESRQYIQEEVRKFYGRYDLLGTPRRFIGQMLLAPLRALGLLDIPSPQSRQEALARIRRKIDFESVRAALTSFNLSVLEKLSPKELRSPLFRSLRRPGLFLAEEEIRAHIASEQERLVLWLEETFGQLAQGISKSKEFGIYSTSILWGGLILALETAVGGGITVLEAVLDSAIAPFVTKGAVEVFAYHEIQKIGRELVGRYEAGLVAVLRLQRDRFVECLGELSTSENAVERLDFLAKAHHKSA